MSFPRNLNQESVDAAEPVEPLLVEPDARLADVFALLKAQNVGSVLICREGALVGIFTERDALKLIAGGANLDVPIESVMIPNPTTLAVDCSVGEAIARMARDINPANMNVPTTISIVLICMVNSYLETCSFITKLLGNV